jgi:hypothetical protein
VGLSGPKSSCGLCITRLSRSGRRLRWVYTAAHAASVTHDEFTVVLAGQHQLVQHRQPFVAMNKISTGPALHDRHKCSFNFPSSPCWPPCSSSALLACKSLLQTNLISLLLLPSNDLVVMHAYARMNTSTRRSTRFQVVSSPQVFQSPSPFSIDLSINKCSTLIVVLAVTQKCSHSFFFQDKKKSLFHLTDLASTTLTS